MKHLRFWQKIYLAALAVFLVAMNGGFALAGSGCHDILYQSEIDQALNDQHVMAQSLAHDLTAAEDEAKPFEVRDLAHAYASQFDTLVRVERNDETLYTTSGYDRSDPSLHAEAGTQVWERVTFANSGAYILVGGGLTNDDSGLQLTLAHSLKPMEDAWRSIVWRLVITSAAISVIGAVGLFFALRGLSAPLQQLAGVTDAYAAGDRTVRAAVQGDDEVAALAISFNNMADSVDTTIEGLKEAAETNARMAAALSHEVRTPLTAIRGYAEYLMIANATPEERVQAADYVIHESTRLQRIAERMLQLFAIERTPLELRSVMLADIVSAAVATARPKAQVADVTLNIQEDTLLPCAVQGDEVLLESLMVNLIDNAVAASEPGACVRLRMEPDDSFTVPAVGVVVSDEGRGIAPEELARLGEAFYRPDKARSRAQGGAGLGVALAIRIADVHGATLFYASEKGRGTEATVVFPVLDEALTRP